MGTRGGSSDMTAVLTLIDKIFDLLLRLMRPLSAFAVLAVFAVLTAVISLLVVRWTSNQKAIRHVKDLMGAHVLEVRLFPDQLSVVLRAYFTLLGNTLLYLRYTLVPLLILGVPLVILFAQLESYFGNRPVTPGDEFIVRAIFPKAEALRGVTLTLPSGLEHSPPAFHIPPDREVDWRVRAQRAGAFDISVVFSGSEYSKRIVAGQDLTRITPDRERGGAWRQLINPGEPPLPSTAMLDQISIQYPPREFQLRSWKIAWLIPYIVLTLLAALVLKGALRTEL